MNRFQSHPHTSLSFALSYSAPGPAACPKYMIEWIMDMSWARFRKGLFANGSEVDPKGLEMAPKIKLNVRFCVFL